MHNNKIHQRPLIRIPVEKLPEMIGHSVHAFWAQTHGMVWLLREIIGDRVRLETRKTNKTLYTGADQLCYTRGWESRIKYYPDGI